MIKASTMYKLAVNGVIIAEGSKQKMMSMRKQYRNARVWNSPSSKVGDKIGN